MEWLQVRSDSMRPEWCVDRWEVELRTGRSADQYSSGNKTVVTLLSCSVMIQMRSPVASV